MCLADMAGRWLFADGEIILEVHKLKKERRLFHYRNVKGNEENSLRTVQG